MADKGLVAAPKAGGARVVKRAGAAGGGAKEAEADNDYHPQDLDDRFKTVNTPWVL
jgi:hypothetical protein